MKLTIDLSEQDAATLEAAARTANTPLDQYVQFLVMDALERRHRAAENLMRHLDYMGAQVRPDTTTEQMDAALEEALAHVRPERRWAR